MSPLVRTISGIYPQDRIPSHKLSLALTVLLLGALLLAMSSGTASAQSTVVIGRGFTGMAMSVNPETGLMTVDSKGQFFQVTITDGTVINNLSDEDVGLAGLPAEKGYKIAGLVDKLITDGEGNISLERLIAQKITLIPQEATRSHKWSIAVEKQGDDLTNLGEDGSKTAIPGLGSGFETGDRIIMLVLGSAQDGISDTVRGLFKANIVGDRLDEMAQAIADDPVLAADLANLRDAWETAQELRLQKTAENAGADFEKIVLDAVQVFQRNAKSRRAAAAMGLTLSECSQSAECQSSMATTTGAVTVVDESPMIQITSPSSSTVVAANDVVTVTAEAQDGAGLASVTFNVSGADRTPLTEAPYVTNVKIPPGVSSVEVKVTSVDAEGVEGSDSIMLIVARGIDVGVKITSPVSGATTASGFGVTSRVSTVPGGHAAIFEGDTILIGTEVSGMGAITVVLTVNGVAQPALAAPPYSMSYFVPLTPVAESPPALKITATDGSGNTATDSAEFAVIRKTNAINVTITSPPASTTLKSGDTVVINAKTDDDSEIAFLTFSVGGIDTVDTTAPYTHTHVLAEKASTTAAASNIPPNVFVGKATLNGVAAPDDTVVIAWIEGADAATLTIKVTATANSGNTGSATMSLKVTGLVNAGQGTVADGSYVLTAAQPAGQNLAGKTVTFTIDGKDASQTATWTQGDADIVDLFAK
ncbi:MAG: Ig-like domain-containing protein [Chloroflexi bacterium]|nr:Ig-like domain-containing protein [Chloroflexota bacterium]